MQCDGAVRWAGRRGGQFKLNQADEVSCEIHPIRNTPVGFCTEGLKPRKQRIGLVRQKAPHHSHHHHTIHNHHHTTTSRHDTPRARRRRLPQRRRSDWVTAPTAPPPVRKAAATNPQNMTTTTTAKREGRGGGGGLRERDLRREQSVYKRKSNSWGLLPGQQQ